METPETNSQNTSWIKQSIFFTILFVLLLIYVNIKLNNSQSITSSSAILDFQNKSGAATIESSFTDILVASAGSKKRDDGYELILQIINPSSIALRNISCEFQHNSSNKIATCNDINMVIYPGSSKKLKCFISDLYDSDLKSVEVSVSFDQIMFK